MILNNVKTRTLDDEPNVLHAKALILNYKSAKGCRGYAWNGEKYGECDPKKFFCLIFALCNTIVTH